ncbi:hypothetical protein [Nannocystis bainbridge]|uniref:Uncharacterized protein n=1 Tax=Nannocystis bainbridge TaxID=2995303 RepID=A0ABT5DR43_9BACT|nr:hypothetical protein [Nannocystis bainbridge]MDC0716126.1 hypothetical protein [Nannocystis bainbridge]
MMFTAWILSTVLLASLTSEAKCEPTDLACKAADFVRQAKDAKTPELRAQYLHAAHRSYLALFDQTGDVKHLCAARRMFDRSVATAGKSAGSKARREELEARERRANVECRDKPARTPKPKSPLVARVQDSPRSGDRTELPSATGSAASTTDSANSATDPTAAATAPAAPPLTPAKEVIADLAEVSRSPVHAAPPADLAPVRGAGALPSTSAARPPTVAPTVDGPARAPSPAPASTSAPRPGSDLLIAGGVTLGAGLALTAAASYFGHGLVEVKRDAVALHAEAMGAPTDAQREEEQALGREYRRNGPPALALALTGGASLVTAAILLGIGGKRARAASNTALVPHPGGIAVRMNF